MPLALSANEIVLVFKLDPLSLDETGDGGGLTVRGIGDALTIGGGASKFALFATVEDTGRGFGTGGGGMSPTVGGVGGILEEGFIKPMIDDMSNMGPFISRETCGELLVAAGVLAAGGGGDDAVPCCIFDIVFIKF